MAKNSGYIKKGIGGFYYVQTEKNIIECKPKGIFRKQKIIPLAGDNVLVDTEESTNTICEIKNRKNFFIRPPIANVDIFFIVISITQPVPSTLIIDKLSAIAVDKGAKPIIIITKTDLENADSLLEIYNKTGIEILVTSNEDTEIIEKLKPIIKNHLCVFCGNSGVGKSTLLNKLLPNQQRETGEISRKLGRGRHTTREVEIFDVFDGLIADTPGFASIENEKENFIHKENLQFAFPEIEAHIHNCKFTGCSHTTEIGCAVINAVNNKIISKSRYDNYVSMYQKAKETKDWQIKNK